MIKNHDRSGYFGASDTDFVVGNWETRTFENWWLEKLGIRKSTLDTVYTRAGNAYEHKILASLDFKLKKDKQIILKPLRLRINLDGNTKTTIYEVKTYKLENGFKVSKKYYRQVQVQMFGTGLNAKIVAYGLQPYDYLNFLNPIDPARIKLYDIPYDSNFIKNSYLPRLIYLSKCLKNGSYPKEADYDWEIERRWCRNQV